MTPIHELLARMRWDAEFAAGRFEIGYLDHMRNSLVRLPLERIHFPPEQKSAFEAVEEDGSVHRVPFHRVRAVWRDGELIWSRAAR